jgi:hypothetical protein
MGLDMYLSKKIYVGGNYEHNNVKGEVNLTKGKDDERVIVDLSKLSEIVEVVGYWRKANHIHRWFVENVQAGQDDCRDYYVSEEDFENLLDLCKKTLEYLDLCKCKVEATRNGNEINEYKVYEVDEEIINNLLPTSSGFFFGNTDYDSWYRQDIENTIEIVEECLKDTQNSFYYSSSW